MREQSNVSYGDHHFPVIVNIGKAGDEVYYFSFDKATGEWRVFISVYKLNISNNPVFEL